MEKDAEGSGCGQFEAVLLSQPVCRTTGYRLNDQGVRVRVPVGSRIFLLRVVQTGSEVHPTSYSMENGAFLLGGRAARS
jgi:hypothetical protein